jgi:hypothetical protein
MQVSFYREIELKDLLQEFATKEDIYGGSDEDEPEVAELVRKKIEKAVFLPPTRKFVRCSLLPHVQFAYAETDPYFQATEEGGTANWLRRARSGL